MSNAVLNSSPLNTSPLNGLPDADIPDFGWWDIIGWSDSLAAITGWSSSDTLIVSDDAATWAILSSDTVDTLVVADTLAPCTILSSDTVESLQFLDVPHWIEPPLTFTETVVFGSEVALWSLRVAAAETLVFSETLGPSVLRSANQIETIEVQESAAWRLSVNAGTETLCFRDTWGASISGFNLGVETLLFQEVATWIEGGGAALGRAYVVNSDTAAVGVYELPEPVTSLCVQGRVLYLATATGLYAADASTDDGSSIYWILKTGLSNFGTDFLKRVQDVNVLGSADQETALNVVTTRLGVKRRDTFIMPSFTRDAPRDGLIKVGKGLDSVYWGLEWEGYGPARVDGIVVVPVAKSRRR